MKDEQLAVCRLYVIHTPAPGAVPIAQEQGFRVWAVWKAKPPNEKQTSASRLAICVIFYGVKAVASRHCLGAKVLFCSLSPFNFEWFRFFNLRLFADFAQPKEQRK